MNEATSPIRGPSILTADGEYFDYENPDPAHFTLNAIAQGLSNTCRFAGQSRNFYSVAEHSVHVSRLVPPAFAVHALLHDAAEAFIGDVPTPLKRMLPDFKALEKRVEAALFATFGLPPDIPDEVKLADRVMLEVERRALFDRHDPWEETEGLPRPEVTIHCFGPGSARNWFLNRARALGLDREIDNSPNVVDLRPKLHELRKNRNLAQGYRRAFSHRPPDGTA